MYRQALLMMAGRALFSWAREVLVPWPLMKDSEMAAADHDCLAKWETLGTTPGLF